MKPAVIYFINFFHVAVIKLRERKVTRNGGLTLISLYSFFYAYLEFMAISKFTLPFHRIESLLDKLIKFCRPRERARASLATDIFGF